MEFVDFDVKELRTKSFNRNINQLFGMFFENTPHSSYNAITISEYYEASPSMYSSFNNTTSMRSVIEIVPTIYKNSLNPNEEEYRNFRENYFKQIIVSYLFSEDLPLDAYKLDISSKKLLKPESTTSYENMESAKWKFNNMDLYQEEVIKFLFEYYYNEIEKIIKDLSEKQPTYFKKIKEATLRNVQPDNVRVFMELLIKKYKRLIELEKIYNSENQKQHEIVEELKQERNLLVKQIQEIDDQLSEGEEKGHQSGKRRTLSSGAQSAKLFMYDENGGFIQNVLFAFLVGLTSGLSFFFVSSLVKFILNRI